jgi:hypothetical protein
LIFGTRFNIDKKVIDGILIECVKTLNKYLTKKVRKLFDVDFSSLWCDGWGWELSHLLR